MKTVQYTFWQDGEFFIGYLNEYPEYQTQGYSKEELLENLKDLLQDIESGEIPFIRKVEEMEVAG
jgi:predicted RNase H-like HicB family nuclease